MLLVALLLVLATAAFTVLVVVENFSGGPEYTVELFGERIATLSAPGLFLSGVALALIFCLGLVLIGSALKRHRRMREVLMSAPTAPAAGEQGERPPRSETGYRRRGRHLFGH
ncbi:hypothetical protein ACIBQ5_33010 [Streptomyces massasporeus]|uniref:hypothetical protein n=1 Tax=Streptomyces massasporeus TaxID=67324 RepID=UPI0037A86439